MSNSRPDSKDRAEEPDGLMTLVAGVNPCDGVDAVTEQASSNPLNEVLSLIAQVSRISRFEASAIEQELEIAFAPVEQDLHHIDNRYYQLFQARTSSASFPIVQFIQPFVMAESKAKRLRAYACPGLNVYAKDIGAHFQKDEHLVADRPILGFIRHSYVVERQRMSAYFHEATEQLVLLSWSRRDEGPFSEPIQYLVDLLEQLSRLPDFHEADLAHLLGTHFELRPSHNSRLIAKIAVLPDGPVSSVQFHVYPKGKEVRLSFGQDRIPIMHQDLGRIYWAWQSAGTVEAPNLSYRCEPLDNRELWMSCDRETSRLLSVRLGPFIT